MLHRDVEGFADRLFGFGDSSHGVHTLTGHKSRTFQQGCDFSQFERITVQCCVAAVGTGRSNLAHERGRRHLSTGHSVDCVVDEGVGPKDFEDPEDFAEPGKEPFDHVYETLFMHAM